MNIIAFILVFGLLALYYVFLKQKAKGGFSSIDERKLKYVTAGFSLISIVGIALYIFQTHDNKPLDIVNIIFASLIGAITILDAYMTFYLLYYRKNVLNIEEDENKKRKFKVINVVLAYALIPLVVIFLQCLAPSFNYYFDKLLIDFGSGNGVSFYAVFIIIGALTTYLVSEHYVVKEGYGAGNLENCLYIAFPSGIIGARIWYVIAEWNHSFAGQDFSKVFAVWEGGLAIQGGVLLGAIVGIAYMMIRHKNIPILFLVDTIIPAILLAQAIGRWGNFMNHEVYGSVVDASAFPWNILPTWITGQMSVTPGDMSKIYVPLFLIEGLLNVAGYFIIAYGIRKGLKKIIVPGDQACAYFIFYGIVRFILEPLRNPAFIMGTADGIQKSVWMSIAFIVGGIIGVIALHIYHHIKQKKELVQTQE